MNKLILGWAAFLVMNFHAYSYQTQDCNCSEVFEDVVKGVEANYLPLKLEGTGINNKTYQKRIESFRKTIQSVIAENCTEIIQEFLNFFEDEHLFVFEQPEYSDEELADFKSKIKASKLGKQQLIDEVLNYRGKEKLVGFYWDGTSTLAILPKGQLLEVRILESTSETVEPGEIKASFKATSENYNGTYYSYNYAPRHIEGGLFKQDSLFSLNGGIIWKKMNPSELNKDLSTFDNPALPYFTDLGNGTTVFTIPSFSVDYQQFIGILRAHLPQLQQTTYLIFDIRGNTGGNAIYFSFIEAYAKQNLRSSQGKVLASEATLAYFERLAKNSPAIYQPVVDEIKTNMGKVVNGPAYPEREYKPSTDFNISKVAILTDEGCMSASESFIIHSKGVNPDIQTFGKPTAGVIDYTSVNAIPVPSGNRNIYFGYPTSSLHMDIPKNGFNKTGMKPDVTIADKVKDPIQFIVDYWKN